MAKISDKVRAEYYGILKEHVPERCIDEIIDYMEKYAIHMSITRKRFSKHGDYSPPGRVSRHHRITVNHNLNKYHFLLTFYHELAHLLVWEKYGNQVAPHGKEWQKTFQNLMQDKLTTDCFPAELLPVLKAYFSGYRQIKATTTPLLQALRKYDEDKNVLTVEDIPEGTAFILQNGAAFVKGRKLRTYFLCKEIHSGKEYRVRGTAEARIIDEKS